MEISMQKEKCTAIVLAAGQGRRMGTKIQKQYLKLEGKPILYYSLRAFETSPLIDEIILVTESGWEEYCRENIVDYYGISKVKLIVAGGKERYLSVQNGLESIEGNGYVFIHDGARPFVDLDTIERAYREVHQSKACVVGMPVKDTIKIADEQEYVSSTPNREKVWMIQTPQVFELNLIKGAYNMLMRESYIKVTDDAMVVEQTLGYPIKLIRGSYENIKITTPEDLDIAKIFLEKAAKEKK
ncbi:MAG: 2-C-methyl-D-erythritol 4-phosphate cytidylyltransferase [Hespellia sp.]|nr:2-C-methyl-D-erythritol 4-phosphate cytidylyltransferase [Hespellia sp.]